MNVFHNIGVFSFFEKLNENDFFDIYKFNFHSGLELEVSEILIKTIKKGDQISITHLPYDSIGIGDCSRDIKLSEESTLYKRQGMHGSQGAWDVTNRKQAVIWLSEAFINNLSKFKTHDACIYFFKKRKK